MSIATEINNLKTNILNAYTSIQTKGGTIPTNKNTENLSSAIESITTGTGGGDFSEYFTTPITVGTSTSNTGILNSLKKIPSGLTITDGSYLFTNCKNLTNVSELTNCTVSNPLKMSSMFYGCSSLTTIPNFVNSATGDMSSCFYNCGKLTALPNINTHDVTSMAALCYNNQRLTQFPSYDTYQVGSFSVTFSNCVQLTTIPLLDAHRTRNFTSAFLNCPALTTLGGFQNYGQAFATSASANANQFIINLSTSTNLTEQSLINVLTNLYDIATKGVKTQTVQLGATNLAKLTSEEGQSALTQAQNFGWTIS